MKPQMIDFYTNKWEIFPFAWVTKNCGVLSSFVQKPAIEVDNNQ